jgi:hypothetical protein
MVRLMCSVTLKDRKSSDELFARLGVEDVEVVKRGRLLWFGHVEHKSRDDWVKMCRNLVVEGTRRKVEEENVAGVCERGHEEDGT